MFSTKHHLRILISAASLISAAFAIDDPVGSRPAWWTTGANPVIDPNAPAGASNQSPVNIGQAKHMVTSALDALGDVSQDLADAIRTDLAGTEDDHSDRIIDLDVPTVKTAQWLEKQKAPLLIGQLKEIAAPFYDMLHIVAPLWLDHDDPNPDLRGQLQLNNTKQAVNPQDWYPWSVNTGYENNRSVATIGQLKAVYALRFDTLPQNPDLTALTDLIALKDAMKAGVDDRLNASYQLETVTSVTMPLFSGMPAFWTPTWSSDTPPKPQLGTASVNANFWLNDIRSKVTGFHMYAISGGSPWYQQYGLIPITPHHLLSCGHNGPPPSTGNKVCYFNADGTIGVSLTLYNWINHYGTQYPAIPDLSVYLVDNVNGAGDHTFGAIPEGLLPKIFPALSSFEKYWLAKENVPTVVISQGNSSNDNWPNVPDSWTPNNRMAWVQRLGKTLDYLDNGGTSLRNHFYHHAVSGDSGNPIYFIINNDVYLNALLDAAVVADNVGYINSLIAEANQQAGRTEVETVTLAPRP